MEINEIAKSKKAGLGRPIVCKKCGKRVGYVTIKRRFKWHFIFWMLVIAIGTQIFGQIVSDYFYKIVFGVK